MGRDEKNLVFNFRQKCDKKQKFEFLHTYTSMTNLKDKFLNFKLIGKHIKIPFCEFKLCFLIKEHKSPYAEV